VGTGARPIKFYLIPNTDAAKIVINADVGAIASFDMTPRLDTTLDNNMFELDAHSECLSMPYMGFKLRSGTPLSIYVSTTVVYANPVVCVSAVINTFLIQ